MPPVIRTTVNQALKQSGAQAIQDVEIAAVRKLKSGDLDLFTYTPAEKERIVHNSASWLPRLGQGHLVKIMGPQHTILVHNVPALFLPRARAVTEAVEEVRLANPTALADTEITYLGWAKGHLGVDKKQQSSIVLALSDPVAANTILQNGLFLRSERLRTELYDLGCRVVQCAKCLRFGHVMAICSCPYCSLPHSRKRCPDYKYPNKYKYALCGGRYAATDRQKCPKWTEQLGILEAVRRKKARLLPAPAPALAPSTAGPPVHTQSGLQAPTLMPESEGQPENEPRNQLEEQSITPIPSLTAPGKRRLRSATSGTQDQNLHDPPDDHLPSFGETETQTVRQKFRQRIIAQLL
jgi:hypothetical protein